MAQEINIRDDEIALSEILAILWSHKTLIGFITSISIFFSGYYALTTEKKYTATAIFQFGEKDNNFKLPGELNSLSAIAGLNLSGNSNTKALLERTMGREFILNFGEKVSLKEDSYFNTYDPNYKDPVWKAFIKKLIGWKRATLDEQAFIESSIIANFKEFISVESTVGGAISVSATHEDPEIAARYANTVMNEMKELVERENKEAQDIRLIYLSETLADALQEMETSEQRLKEYALQNSARAKENFLLGSLRLDELRMEKREVQEIEQVLSILENILKKGKPDEKSYEALRLAYPLVDDVNFRRILGMSETISSWSWPDLETNKAVSATLRDRIKRLDLEIKSIEDDAKIYATSAEDLTKLTRDAKVAEATYTVLIEQVKSQSLAAGFNSETFKLFENATAPLSPSSPNRNLILAIGGFLGCFLGCLIAILISVWKGNYYTRSLLISESEPNLAVSSKPFRRITRYSISKILEVISQRRFLEIDETEVRLADKKVIYILNSGGRPTAAGTARLLAAQSSISGRNVILCNTTDQVEGDIKSSFSIADLPVLDLGKNLKAVQFKQGSSFFTSSNIKSVIENLASSFDQVIISSGSKDGILGLMALKDFDPCLIVLARTRVTRKLDISKIKSNHPIEILLYD